MGTGGGGPVEISSGPADVEDRRTNNELDDMDDLDSKETRLTLMEEVLLLGLKDKEVKIIFLLFIKWWFSKFSLDRSAGLHIILE